MRCFFAAAALLSIASATFANDAPLAPSAEALALARMVSAGEQGEAQIQRAREAIARDLLTGFAAWRGAPCDAKVPACQNAAETLAREAAPRQLEQQRAISDAFRATLFDATMTMEEITAAQRFVTTQAGRSFARALAMSTNPVDWPPQVRARVSRAAVAMFQPLANDRSLRDRFYDMTAKLPRKNFPAPPAPPR